MERISSHPFNTMSPRRSHYINYVEVGGDKGNLSESNYQKKKKKGVNNLNIRGRMLCYHSRTPLLQVLMRVCVSAQL